MKPSAPNVSFGKGLDRFENIARWRNRDAFNLEIIRHGKEINPNLLKS